MIIVLSPSKSMDMECSEIAGFTQPDFLLKSETLISAARQLSELELMDFMDISKNLAQTNHSRFKAWSQPFTIANAKPAIFAFTGDVYDGLDAHTLTPSEQQFAQTHLRILSGLYGLLKPLDLIQAYRLEMGRHLKTKDANNLYEFWRETITTSLNSCPGKLLVNLASQEYFKSINKKTLNKAIVTPVFKDYKNGNMKVISFYAKKARGAMARFIIKNKLTSSDALVDFTEGGYIYNHDLSTETTPTFTRSLEIL